jgi:hypothetical protein
MFKRSEQKKKFVKVGEETNIDSLTEEEAYDLYNAAPAPSQNGTAKKTAYKPKYTKKK